MGTVLSFSPRERRPIYSTHHHSAGTLSSSNSADFPLNNYSYEQLNNAKNREGAQTKPPNLIQTPDKLAQKLPLQLPLPLQPIVNQQQQQQQQHQQLQHQQQGVPMPQQLHHGHGPRKTVIQGRNDSSPSGTSLDSERTTGTHVNTEVAVEQFAAQSFILGASVPTLSDSEVQQQRE
uniref:Uncharacterized protein n=1 Tax=Anopheles farauti TaxID=69004 RepID=A0A182QL61_9DIPT